jgi:pyruvate/2-oxoglutarate dehydrogenase complex dihydrolipoamide dehydrogenase (E3) component/uncharacterized membrane protein YdjX (TVP38/TMEM64 family)
MSYKRVWLLLIIGLLAAVFFALDLQRFFTLDYFKSQQAALEAFRGAHPWQAAGGFFAVYVMLTALSFPGAALMTLVAGAVFGVWWGIVIVSFASSIGAMLAFFAARFIARDAVQRRFGDRLRAVNHGVDREGGFYLFTLRLVPLFPFFAVNLLMGLTPLRGTTFYWVSQVGMLPGTAVYVNAGTQLAQIDSLGGIVSPSVLLSFALLGVFPLLAKHGLGLLRARRVLRRWPRPAHFDRNVVVIGAGSAGLVTAYIASAVKAKVTLVEKHKMGGDCLNTGCVPSKALLRTAKLMSQINRSGEFGVVSAAAEVDFPQVMERVHRVIGRVAPHDSVERYTGLGVEVLQGTARIVSPYHVEVTTVEGVRMLSTRAIVVAAGARPFVPSLPGLNDVGYLTSDSLWNLRSLPRRLLVLGGGPIGCELAQAFARLGSEVTQIDRGARLMRREDADVSALVLARFQREGINVLLQCTPQRFALEDGEKVLHAQQDGKPLRVEFDEVLVALGRVANTRGYGLEALGIDVAAERPLATNEFLQTLYPNIYACGDVAGPYQFTHTAAHQAWYAAVNALFGDIKKFRVDYSVIPWATFTDPEVARVGLNESEARDKGIAFEVTTYGIDDLDRAIADGEAHGMVKVLTVPGKDRILGVTIVGEHAADLLAEFVLAMKNGIGLNKILATIHIYPTLAEANKYAAGAWKRAHAPATLLRWVQRYHAWRRRGSGGRAAIVAPEQ